MCLVLYVKIESPIFHLSEILCEHILGSSTYTWDVLCICCLVSWFVNLLSHVVYVPDAIYICQKFVDEPRICSHRISDVFWNSMRTDFVVNICVSCHMCTKCHRILDKPRICSHRTSDRAYVYIAGCGVNVIIICVIHQCIKYVCNTWVYVISIYIIHQYMS